MADLSEAVSILAADLQVHVDTPESYAEFMSSFHEPQPFRDAWLFVESKLGPDLDTPFRYLVLGKSVVAYQFFRMEDEAAYEIAMRHNDQDMGA